MSYYTHINRGTIDSNRKRKKLDPNAQAQPAVRFQKGKYGKSVYAFEVEIDGPSKVVYSGDGDPILPCGARIVIISEVKPRIIR